MKMQRTHKQNNKLAVNVWGNGGKAYVAITGESGKWREAGSLLKSKSKTISKLTMVPSAAIASAMASLLVITVCLFHLHPSHGFSLVLPSPVSRHADIATRCRRDHKGRRGTSSTRINVLPTRRQSSCIDHDSDNDESDYSVVSIVAVKSRRSFFAASMAAASSSLFMASSARALGEVEGIAAATDASVVGGGSAKSTADATITDKIFIEFKGLSPPSSSSDGQSNTNDRIVIGLFGNDAPQPVSILKQLVTKDGYKDSKCKSLDTSRTLIKEQLEANKVYNTCMETEDTTGVNYDYASVWRVIPNERVDVGAVSGRFVARENPNFVDGSGSGDKLRHDAAGVVSVRRGNEGGFGFTIFPGGGSNDAARILDEDNIVVGRVLEGMDVVQRLNELPVVKQSAGSILGGGGSGASGKEKSKVAPSRGCRYGGTELYCNEYKPLRKVLLDKTGVL